MPGEYVVTTYDSGHGRVTVTRDGKFDFDPALTHLSGQDTSTLVLHGVQVTVDPTRIDGWWALRGVTGDLDTSTPVTVTVMPGQYRFLAPDAGLDFVFTVTPGGTVDYDPSLTYLSGQGTPTLIVGQSGGAAFLTQSDGRNRQLFNLITFVLLTVTVLVGWRSRRHQGFWRPPKLRLPVTLGTLSMSARFACRKSAGIGPQSVRRVRWRGLRSPLA
jgi:hypothetical protein